jgi:hypothetical protein
MYMVFVDLTKAYDKVNRSVLWVVLRNIGIPEKMISLIRGLLDGSRANISIKGKIVHGLDLNTGLKQGSAISPVLFPPYYLIFTLAPSLMLGRWLVTGKVFH